MPFTKPEDNYLKSLYSVLFEGTGLSGTSKPYFSKCGWIWNPYEFCLLIVEVTLLKLLLLLKLFKRLLKLPISIVLLLVVVIVGMLEDDY